MNHDHLPFKARRKPEDVEAIQFDGHNFGAMLSFGGLKCELHRTGDSLYVRNSEGLLRINTHSYLVRNRNDSFDVYTPQEFVHLFTIEPDVTPLGECDYCGWPIEEHSEGELRACQTDLLSTEDAFLAS